MGGKSRSKAPRYTEMSSPLGMLGSLYSERQRTRSKPVPAPVRVKVAKPTKTRAGRAVKGAVKAVTSPLTRNRKAPARTPAYGTQNRIRMY